MRKLQQCDPYCRRIVKLLGSDKQLEAKFVLSEANKLLYRVVYDGEVPKHLALVIPPS